MTDGHLTFLSSTEGHNKLVELLRNHVVQSTTLEVYNAVSSPTLVTMANQVLTINVTENGQILVNGAAVLEAAVEAKNGRLYVLDGVLTPPSIQPVLPHRCDITETKTVRGECVRCSKVKLSQCSSGVYTVRHLTLFTFRSPSVSVQVSQSLSVYQGASIFGCVYTLTFGSVPGNIVATGCSPLCNATVKCLEGVAENGSCVCDQNFRGSRCQYCSSSNKHGPNCDTTCLCVHGQCDNRPDSNGGCKVDSCLPGFTGRFCDRRTAVCGVQGQFCHAHADCDFSEGTIRCVCKPGYQGDGITCVEADPCAPPLRGGCSVNAKCIKTGAGTRSCQCLTGWREDGDECQPINNCDGPDRGGCHSNATCIYVGPGQASCRRLSSQWTCVCDDGYLGDGHLCFGTVEEELVVLLEASQFSRWTTLTTVGGATITTSDITATNGLIHIIDQDYNLTDEIQKDDEFTVFAPTDSAVSTYLQKTSATALDVNTTRYHVVAAERLLKTDLQPGGYKQTLLGFSFQLGIFPRDGKLFVNDAQINSSNILSGNGVIHGLSAVLHINRNRCDEAIYKKVMVQNPRNRRVTDTNSAVYQPLLFSTGNLCVKDLVCPQVQRCCAGFFGPHCEPCPGPQARPCSEVESGVDDLCGSVKCHSSANCVIELSGPRCLCAAGFQGNGTSCQATDPCVDDNGGCSLDAVCKRTRPGRRECVCNNGFSGDGLVCVEINACLEGNGGCHANADCVHVGPNKKNGGCHQSARCNMTAPGVRTCTCRSNFLGDGLTCKGTLAKEMLTRKLRDFYLALTLRSMMTSKRKETCGAILRSHIVMCHTLLPADLSRPRNLTSLSGLVLTTSSSQSNIFINQVNVTYSDGISINGIFHEIDKVLLPPDVDTDPDVALNLTDVADRHGYRSFYKLLQDTGVVDLLSDGTTVFMPSDAVMASLPQQQRDFLFHPDHRPQLVEYLKYHVLQGQRIYAEGLIHLDSARTLQGSSLSFNCGGTDDIGEIFVNDGKCRIVQRHLVFTGGLAYGIDCLLTPPSLGGRCDEQSSFDLKMSCGICSTSAVRCPKGSKQKEIQKCDLPKMFVTKNSGCLSVCTVNFWQPKCCHGYHGRDCLGGAGSPCGNRGKCDDGHLGNGTCTCDAGFGGMACEQCSDGFFGPTCKACNCSQHASCDDGRRGTGSCFCEAGWTGERCDVEQAQVLDCSPSCSPKAVCKENNTCVCRTLYEGDGFTCTVVDMCQWWNGGCAKGAQCSQRGEQVSCSCPKGHSGDGFTCQPVDPCVAVDNGGCHEHATCTMTAPCTCKAGFVGDGVTCEVKQLPISRCLQDNGRCHQDAKCTDLHFEDATLGVFHLRSDRGQYKLNYTRAQQACAAEGGGLATYTQLAYAQQGGLNMCAVGWLDEARAAYPTTYSNPNCGFGHVGIVDYGVRRNLSETWDAFCYRRKEVSCECQPGFVGDGFRCTGNLLQVLASTPTFSNFLTQIRNNSETSSSGKQFVQRLSNLTVQSTLFVPDNDGLPGNQTLSQRDIEFHLSEGRALPLSELRNGSRMRTRVGSLMVVGVSDLLDPSALSSRYINDRFVTDSDILASNGIIHVLQGALKAPPPRHEMQVGHKAGMGVGVTLLVILVAAGGCVGYNFYSNKTKGFNFHYFKDEEEEEEAPHTGCSRSICNPVYESAPESESCDVTAADKHEEDRGSCDLRDGGSRDLLRDGGSRDLRDGGSCDLLRDD
ncbi:hypothetical protein F2P81_017791 [Scophthalmus maximus]|uniref:Stabilin-2-like n=1 Tax=Scophthalmus maximus TaxID=52904 RepID=A0A6A4S0E9_SCOMX|nr:hypothetical protein F2P81_017791 [Scophthalmus maximus]